MLNRTCVSALLFVIATCLINARAVAATTAEFVILFDSDNNATTGCAVQTAEGTF